MKNEMEQAGAAGLTAAERLAIVTLYRAFSDGDPGLLDGAVTADWQDIPLNPGQAPGRDGAKSLIVAFRAAFPDMAIVVHEIVGGAGRAGVRAAITGTHTGEWFGVKPTGRAVRIPLHEFHHLADGKVTHTWHLEDWFGWLNQVSAWPPAPTKGG